MGKRTMNKAMGLFGLSLMALTAGVAQAQSSKDRSVTDGSVTDKPTEVIIRARRLDAAQQAIQPDVGASSYSVPEAIVKALPGGDNASLSDVILQAPGVTQDSYGQLHIRGD